MPTPLLHPPRDGYGSGIRRPALAPYRVRIAMPDVTEEVDLLEGPTLIGRSAECTLILDHPLVSRRHAMLEVEGARVRLTDLGSRNGCLLNGKPISGSTELGPGDRFRIGDTDFELIPTPRAKQTEQRSELRRAQTVAMETVYVDVETGRPAPSDSTKPTSARVGTSPSSSTSPVDAEPSSRAVDENTRQGHFLELVGPVAEKALALGRADEASRLLGGQLERMAESAKRGQRPTSAMADLAADFATRLAEATNDPRWIGVAFQIFIAERRPLPLPAIDRLFGVMRRLPGAHRPLLDEYVRVLQARKDALTPAERFGLQRLESLARVAAL